MVKIAGNTFVVTGGASGLGEGVVRQLVSQQANVIILDYNKIQGERVAKEHPSQILFPGPVDVSSEEQVARALDESKKTFSILSGAVLCAGIMSVGLTAALPEHLHPYGLQGLAALRKLYEVNVVGTFNVAQQVSQRIIEQNSEQAERGGIILTSSYTATDGQGGSVGYSSTKGAIASMVLPMARDLSRYGIRVNAISPGVFLTPINDQFIKETSKCGEFPTRPGRPEEFGRFVQHVLENEMINGAILRQDGALRGAISIEG